MTTRTLGRTPRTGFTLLEVIISIMIMLLIFTATVSLFRVNTKAVGANAQRLDAQQNSRFVVAELDRQLRLAGIGVANQQPMVVQASPLSITFNADMVTRSAADAGAVYYDPSADTLAVMVLPKERRITLPAGGTYPDSTYSVSPGFLSRAETISFFAREDSSTARSDDYVLFRRVNDGIPRVIAKSLIIPSGQYLFRYFKSDTLGNVTEIPQGSLPLTHTAPFHGGVGDTLASALTDSIRSVRVHIETVYRDPNKGIDVTRVAERGIRLINSGMNHFSQCGAVPQSVSSLTAAVTGGNQVTLTWNPSPDETGGEKDVFQYALFRRKLPNTDWDETLVSVPAGDPSYSYDDTSVPSGQYVYAVSAIDCTPAPSALTSSVTVTIP